MSKSFDMELFLAGVLIGSYATQQRHVRQAKIIQGAIAERWHRENPWTWQKKHVVWFLENCLSKHSQATQYYYVLTVRLLARRLDASWVFKSRRGHKPDVHDRLQSARSGHAQATASYRCQF